MDAHPIADLFPHMTDEEKADLKADMSKRAENGLDPLEHAILIYEDRILDGRHRWRCWQELAAEGACSGFFARNRPPMDRFTPAKHGTLLAWMRAKSANMVQRHIPADRKAAIFLKAVEDFPELKAAVEAIKAENADRKKAGRPLGAGDRRGNTAEQVGKLANVGATTVKQVKKLKAAAPEKFEEVAQGKKSVKKALKEVSSELPGPTPRSVPKWKELKAGDTFYTVGVFVDYSSNDCPILKHRVTSINGVVCVTAKGEQIGSVLALTLEEAKEKRNARLAEHIKTLEAKITAMKDAMRKEPQIVSD